MQFSKMQSFEVINCPTIELAETNRVVINPGEQYAKLQHVAVESSGIPYIFTLLPSNKVEQGRLAFNGPSRKWARLISNTKIQVGPYLFEKTQNLGLISLELDFNTVQKSNSINFDSSDMARKFSESFVNQAFTLGQILGFVYYHNELKFTFTVRVKEMTSMMQESDTDPIKVEIGLFNANTLIFFERAEGSNLKLIGQNCTKIEAPRIFREGWDFGSMGIGGLESEFKKIFSRAFQSRIFPPDFTQKAGMHHVKGILLYGPPGTGKTLLARQIAKVLLSREPKIVSGPELLDKFVGESEKNIRALFKEAEDEQAKLGPSSGLHVIIFDEIDSLCKARGSNAGSAGVGDNLVNQLLVKIDGPESLNNVLLIGMTNRRDLIDEALLRPGRFELQLEIGLPNAQGRLEILNIHTEKMKAINIIDSSVNLAAIADITKNYTGAEIAGLVRAATSLAMDRVVKPGNKIVAPKEDDLARMKITQEDFIQAAAEMKPMYGASEQVLKDLSGPVIQWDAKIANIQASLEAIAKTVSEQDTSKLLKPYFVLLLGQENSGLTTLAAHAAINADYPYTRVYQCHDSAGMSESAEIQAILKLFQDGAKSELSCIVIDGLETIFGYHPSGPRYSNGIYKVFKSMKAFTMKRRMLVLCTCNRQSFLDDLSLNGFFQAVIEVPSLVRSHQVVAALSLHDAKPFSSQQLVELQSQLDLIPFKIGIADLMKLVEAVVRVEKEDRIGEFLEVLSRLETRLRT